MGVRRGLLCGGDRREDKGSKFRLYTSEGGMAEARQAGRQTGATDRPNLVQPGTGILFSTKHFLFFFTLVRTENPNPNPNTKLNPNNPKLNPNPTNNLA
jgi:hypothetical protein